MTITPAQVEKWIKQKDLGYNRAFSAAQAYVELSKQHKTLQEALASSLETNQALSKKLLDVKLAGCSALKWMYSEIKAKKDSDENNYNPFVGLYDLLYGDKK